MTTRPVPDAELVIANAAAELRLALDWLDSPGHGHPQRGVELVEQIVAGLEAVLAEGDR